MRLSGTEYGKTVERNSEFEFQVAWRNGACCFEYCYAAKSAR